MYYPCHCGGPKASHCPACWEGDVRTLIATFLNGATEPEQVYNLFFDPKAAAEWKLLFSRWSDPISYSGVFTHQKPYVKFEHPTGTPDSCELSDLLIVLTDYMSQQRWAWLLQAKVSKKWIPYNTSQWNLLTNWPEITYSGNPGVTPVGGGSWPVDRLMPFTGKSDIGGQYLALLKATGEAETSECNKKPSFVELHTSLVDMLNGTAGRRFSWSDTTASDEWDCLIWDLINAIGSTSGTVGGVSVPRGLALLTSGGLGDDDTEYLTFAEGWGIPIVHLGVERRERPN